MIFATAFVLHALLTFNQTFQQRVCITAILLTALLVFSIIHCKINNLNVHSAVFASMILFIAYRVAALIKQVKNPARRRYAGRLARYGSGIIHIASSRKYSKADGEGLSMRRSWIYALASRLARLLKLNTSKEEGWAALGFCARTAWMASHYK